MVSAAKVDHDPRRRDCAKFWYNTGSTASASRAGRLSLLSARWWVQRVRVCSCSGIVEGVALLLCQFLVQSICRPQRLAVVVDVIKRVLTAFLRRVCNWVGKLSVERLSGVCGAILAASRVRALFCPTAHHVARARKLVGWFGFGGGRAAIKNTPASSSAKKSAVVTPRRGIHRPRYPRTPYNLTTFLACRKSFVAECVGVMVAVVTAIGLTQYHRGTPTKTPTKATPPRRRRCRRFVLAVVLLSYGEAVDAVTAAK